MIKIGFFNGEKRKKREELALAKLRLQRDKEAKATEEYGRRTTASRERQKVREDIRNIRKSRGPTIGERSQPVAEKIGKGIDVIYSGVEKATRTKPGRKRSGGAGGNFDILGGGGGFDPLGFDRPSKPRKRKRKARLSQGAIVINVGGGYTPPRKKKKRRRKSNNDPFSGLL